MSVFGLYDGEYGAVERVADHLPVPPPFTPRQRLWKIVARETILAAGAVERPIVFGGNDTPGVMLASAMRTYVNRFAAAPGRRVAVFTTSDDAWRTPSTLGMPACRWHVSSMSGRRSHRRWFRLRAMPGYFSVDG